MHPIFVIEGPDGAGKSTLAKSMVDQFGCHYLHCTYSANVIGNMTSYVEGVFEAATTLAKFFPVVIDRWRASEEVYSTVYRGGRIEGGVGETTRLMEMAIAAGVVFIFCQPEDKDVYLAAFDSIKHEPGRKEMYLDGMGKVYDEYWNHINWFQERFKNANFMCYDRFDVPDVAQYAQLLVRDAYDGKFDNHENDLNY